MESFLRTFSVRILGTLILKPSATGERMLTRFIYYMSWGLFVSNNHVSSEKLKEFSIATYTGIMSEPAFKTNSLSTYKPLQVRNLNTLFLLFNHYHARSLEGYLFSRIVGTDCHSYSTPFSSKLRYFLQQGDVGMKNTTTIRPSDLLMTWKIYQSKPPA